MMMKTIKAVVLLLIVFLSSGGQAFATLIFDLQITTNVTFSNLWDYYSTTVDHRLTGTGEHAEWYKSEQEVESQDLSLSQSVGIMGYVGDDALSQNGTSEAFAIIRSTFTFNLDEFSTDLHVTQSQYYDANYIFGTRWNPLNKTGEYRAGSVGDRVEIHLDGVALATSDYWLGDEYIFHDLIGQLDVTIVDSVYNKSIATYPFIPQPVPEPTMLMLMTTGLIGLIGVARRKARG